MGGLLNRVVPWSGGYRHFNADLRAFEEHHANFRLASINNRSLNLERLGEFRLTRFIRDPRDLVVSGYFYHLSGKESWTNIVEPSKTDWYFANGVVPTGMHGQAVSFTEYLRSLPTEEGLLAELEFRANHFNSMMDWPERHPDILTFRYEDILRDEPGTMRQIFRFYGFNGLERTLGGWLARKHAIDRVGIDKHVRNPSSGQWREYFTFRVRRAFDRKYGSLLKHLGYAPD